MTCHAELTAGRWVFYSLAHTFRSGVAKSEYYYLIRFFKKHDSLTCMWVYLNFISLQLNMRLRMWFEFRCFMRV